MQKMEPEKQKKIHVCFYEF